MQECATGLSAFLHLPPTPQHPPPPLHLGFWPTWNTMIDVGLFAEGFGGKCKKEISVRGKFKRAR